MLYVNCFLQKAILQNRKQPDARNFCDIIVFIFYPFPDTETNRNALSAYSPFLDL